MSEFTSVCRPQVKSLSLTALLASGLTVCTPRPVQLFSRTAASCGKPYAVQVARASDHPTSERMLPEVE